MLTTNLPYGIDNTIQNSKYRRDNIEKECAQFPRVTTSRFKRLNRTGETKMMHIFLLGFSKGVLRASIVWSLQTTTNILVGTVQLLNTNLWELDHVPFSCYEVG